MYEYLNSRDELIEEACSALKTKEEVRKVVIEIDEEYVIIHNIKQEFEQMKNRISILRQNVLSVLNKVKSIMDFNIKIEKSGKISHNDMKTKKSPTIPHHLMLNGG